MRTVPNITALVTLLLLFLVDRAKPQVASNQTVTAIDSRITYVGDWTVADNGGHVFISIPGSFSLDFFGSTVYWYSRKLYNGAVVAVTFDDEDAVYIDLSEGVSQLDTTVVTVLFEKEGVETNESHRLNVSWNGPGSSGAGSFLENYRIQFTGNGSDPSIPSSVQTSSASQASGSSSSSSSSSTPASSSSSPKTNVGAIAGGTIGGVVCGALILVLIQICLRRRRARVDREENMQSATPFLVTQSSRNGSLASAPFRKLPLDGQGTPLRHREDSGPSIPANAARHAASPPEVHNHSNGSRAATSTTTPSPSPSGIMGTRETIHDAPPVYHG